MRNEHQEVKKLFRRKMGLDVFYAVLGDENRVIDEPGFPYMVRVRYTSANAFGQPTLVRFRAVMQKVAGTPVLIEYDDEDQLAVTKPYFSGQVAAGINPVGDNLADESVGYFITLDQIAALHSHAVSTTADSMLVTVGDFMYTKNGVLHWFLGGDGTQTPIDLTAYIPADPAKQCLAGLFLDTTTDLIEIVTSTPIPIGDSFTLADAQECLDGSPEESVPVRLWRLYYGQTGIKSGALEAGGDDFLDLRQFINIPGSGGGSFTSFNVAADSGTPAVIADGETATFAGGSGVSTSVAGQTVTFALVNEVIQDMIASFLANGPGIDFSYNDAGNSLVASAIPYFGTVEAAEVVNVNISSAPSDFDAYTPSSGDRVLLTAQSTASQNGVWIFNGAGNALTRPTDYATGSTILAFRGRVVQALNGIHQSTLWALTSPTTTITIDTTSTTWTQLQVVTLSGQETLDNKSFYAPNTTFFAFQTMNFDLTYLTGDRNIYIPDANTTLLGEDNTATISNKTIDSSNVIAPEALNIPRYRSGLRVLKFDAATVQVMPGSIEVNGEFIEKTAITRLGMATNGDWISGSSDEGASRHVHIYVDASGNIKLHNKAPNYGRPNTANRVATMLVNQATWDGTAAKGLNATSIVYDNDSGEGNIAKGMLLGIYGSGDSDYSQGRGRGSGASASVAQASFAWITDINTGTNTITVAAGHNVAINDNDRLIVVDANSLLYRQESSVWYRWLGALYNNASSDLVDNWANDRAEYTFNEGSDLTTGSSSFVEISSNAHLYLFTNGEDVQFGFDGTFQSSTLSFNAHLNVYIDSLPYAADDGISAYRYGTINVNWEWGFVRQSKGYMPPGMHDFGLYWNTTGATLKLMAGAGTAAGDVHPQFWVREYAPRGV